MRREDVLAYLQRDRTMVDESRTEHWASVREQYGPGESILIAEGLRLEVIAQRPDWPTPEDRAEDLANHERVAELLGRVRRPA